MYSIVCSVTLVSLCLGNVTGCTGENAEYIDSSERNQNFICISHKKHVHQWYHVYPNGSRQQPTYIGNIPTVPTQEKAKTHFIITLETFDNNTEIHCDSGSNAKAKTIVWQLIDYFTEAVSSFWNSRSDYNQSYNFLIRIGTYVTLKDNEEPPVLKYNETQEVSFKCQEYIGKTNLVIGVINTTSNMIESYNRTFPDTKYNKSQNGTVLCCMYYEVNGTADEKWITRHVAKKTLLVYDETVTVLDTDLQDSLVDKGEDAKSQSKQGTDSGKQDADSGKKDANPDTQDADSDNQVSGPSKPATIICIVSAVAVVFILLVVSVIYLKRCRKKPKVEVETKVLYADLDFLRQNEPESLTRQWPEEESPYAQIVGELRPQ